MTALIFRGILILACIHWLNAHQFYQPFEQDYTRFRPGPFMEPSTTLSTEESSEGSKNFNKNVNVVLNVNSEEVAQRLWKIIQENLNQNPSGESLMATKQQLQKAIMPIVSSTRRGLTTVPITEIGDKLEKITRKALIIDEPGRSPVDREIMTRDIVANMMSTLKNIFPLEQEFSENVSSRRKLEIPEMPENSVRKSETDNHFATLTVKIRRADILKIIQSIP